MVNINRRVAVSGLIAASLPSSAVARLMIEPPDAGPLGPTAVGELLAQYKVPGASLAIVQQGELAATYCYGEARTGKSVVPSPLFQAAAISKTINAMAILKLVAGGRIALNDPVNQHLASWKLPSNALTEKTAVTIRMLLSHTGGTTVSGFAGYPPSAPLPSLEQVLDGKSPANSDPIRVAWPPAPNLRHSAARTPLPPPIVIS